MAAFLLTLEQQESSVDDVPGDLASSVPGGGSAGGGSAVSVRPAAAAAVASRRPGRRAGRRKTAVLDAACRVIASRGAEATRFTDVAEASGVPVSTLQYYVGSREDLLVAAFRHASGVELAALAAEVAAARSRWERIQIIVTTALAGYQPGDAEAGLLWIESWHFAIRDADMRVDALRDYAG